MVLVSVKGAWVGFFWVCHVLQWSKDMYSLKAEHASKAYMNLFMRACVYYVCVRAYVCVVRGYSSFLSRPENESLFHYSHPGVMSGIPPLAKLSL